MPEGVRIRILKAWCFSTTASVAKMLNTHPCLFSGLWVDCAYFENSGKINDKQALTVASIETLYMLRLLNREFLICDYSDKIMPLFKVYKHIYIKSCKTMYDATQHRWVTVLLHQSVKCKKDITPLLMHWSRIFLALTHWYIAYPSSLHFEIICHWLYWSLCIQLCIMDIWDREQITDTSKQRAVRFFILHLVWCQWPLLLTWFNFNLSMDK